MTINIDSDSRIWIGRFQNPRFFNTNFAFDGLIDEVEVFGRALDPSEIQAIVAAGPAGKCKNASESLLDLASLVIELNLQQGIENSLDSKLDAALQALQDMNTNNDGAACGTLQAFINAVEAQRGSKISDPEADLLVAAAEEILASLGC